MLLVAGCTTVPASAPSVTPGASSTAILTAAPSSAAPSPSASPSPTPATATEYTADDEQVAKLVTAAAGQAIPQIEQLNKMDPSKLETLFLPLDAWITEQRAAIAARSPSACTAAAVELFNDGLEKYETIRKTFLGWRDWGANGRPFPVAAPGQAVKSFEAAVAALDADCPLPD
jgi:hypothetical protein